MTEARAPGSRRWSLLLRVLGGGVNLGLVATAGWQLGGGWVWRSLVPPRQPVHLRLFISNETHEPARVIAVTVAGKPNVTSIDLPKREDGEIALLDFIQAGYVAPIELEVCVGSEPTPRRAAFVADASSRGECGLVLSIDRTAIRASACGAVLANGAPDWDSWMFGPARSDGGGCASPGGL